MDFIINSEDEYGQQKITLTTKLITKDQFTISERFSVTEIHYSRCSI